VLDKLDTLPEVMRDADRRAGQYERTMLDLVEAAVLQEHVGQVFDGVVVAVDDRTPLEGKVVIRDPAIEAECSSTKPLPLGDDVQVRLTSADVRARLVTFELV
jgi:exoribonuclease R